MKSRASCWVGRAVFWSRKRHAHAAYLKTRGGECGSRDATAHAQLLDAWSRAGASSDPTIKGLKILYYLSIEIEIDSFEEKASSVSILASWIHLCLYSSAAASTRSPSWRSRSFRRGSYMASPMACQSQVDWLFQSLPRFREVLLFACACQD
jgi:hypothetical protein